MPNVPVERLLVGYATPTHFANLLQPGCYAACCGVILTLDMRGLLRDKPKRLVKVVLVFQ